MKKIAIAMSLFAAVALVGCSGKGESKSEDSVKAAEESRQTEQQAAPAEDVVVELQNDDTFLPDEMPLPIVIDFNATWCGPCKQFGPVFHKVAAEYQGKANFASADVDVCKKLADQFKIGSIPAVVIVYPSSAKKENVTTAGYMDEDAFKAFLDSNL